MALEFPRDRRSRTNEPYDAAIVGAGPAGSAAAGLLAAWGHHIVLVQRPERFDRARAESIPPSCRKLFAACRLARAIDAASFYPSTGNTVWWGSDEARHELFPGASGYQVDRGRFDDILRREAIAAGAELRRALVRDVSVTGNGAVVRLDGGGEMRARLLLDCSGRVGVVARREWRTDIAAHPRTVALNAVWEASDGWRSVDPTHTLIESYSDGWAWSVPLSTRVRHVSVMVDPQRTRLARGRSPSEVYDAELRKAPHLNRLVRSARMTAGPWGSDASVYSARTFATDPVLLVGDAASSIDPLSSYGIKKALASAWLAAVAVHTSLRSRSMTSAALALFADRERSIAASLLGQSRLLFEDAAAAHRHAFWTDRATDLDLPELLEPDVRALREDPRVQEAFARLKAGGSIALRAPATLRREAHPVVRGHEIVLEDHLVSPAWPNGLRYLRDVDLVGVLTLAPDYEHVPALFEAYNQRYPPVPLPDFLGVLSVMLAFGFLEDLRTTSEAERPEP